MGDNKRYYWIKLKTDFFNQQTIDFLLSQKNGCEYIVLYQMLCLNTANNNGEMCSKIGEMIVPYNVEKIVRDTKYFDFDTVTIALELFKKLGLIYEENDKILKISNFDEMVGSEVSSAKRVREYRAKKALLEEGEKIPKKEPKSNAIRQKQFRAKKQCEQKQHIPYIEDYINNKRYNGNYYIVIQRDKYKCALCNSIENLCVHHIDGYDELKPENSNENKMITLCRNCHSNVHSGQKIDEDTLNSIDYYIDSNEMLLCNNDVTQEIEYRDKSIDKDINIENNNNNNYNYIYNNSSSSDEIINFIESNFGRTLSSFEFEKINCWLNEFDSDIVKHAIELSILNNKRTFAYIEGILKNWKSCGYKILDDITTKEDKPKTKEELKKEYAKMGYIYE